MAYRLQQSRLVWLGIGLCVGLLSRGSSPHTPLHAWSNDRYDDFAIATGPMDETTEAIYFLDFLTGDLKAAASRSATEIRRLLSDQHPQRSRRRHQQDIPLHDDHRHGLRHPRRPRQRPPRHGHAVHRQLRQRPHRRLQFRLG